MDNKKGFILIILLILVLSSVLFFTKGSIYKIKRIGLTDLEEYLSNKKYSLVYFGNISDEQKNILTDIHKNNKEIEIYYINTDINEANAYLGNHGVSKDNIPFIVLYKNGNYQSIIDVTNNYDEYLENINKTFYETISENEINYKTIDKANDYIKKVNSKEKTVAIFGYNDCSFCKLYLPVFNKVAKEKNVDLYYFNRDNYDKNEYNKIMQLDLTIPAKCSVDDKELKFSEGFPKPMTIITKGGKLVDCLRGYVTEEDLIKFLTDNDIIKEEK